MKHKNEPLDLYLDDPLPFGKKQRDNHENNPSK